ncbi:MAG: calcium-binding protein, partial [Mycobacterium sp.]|nr:calcium-binding protein [Mycobacterium sp.]
HLSRANWDTNKYSNYGRQPAELQVRSRNGTTYVPVGTFTADSNGNYRTTVRASYDRYYRWHFAGDSTTGHSDATGKLVDVR